MAYLRLADAGATNSSLPVVIQDLQYHPSTYYSIIIYGTGLTPITVTGGGGTSLKYYTTPAQFTGLKPGTRYGFRVEATYERGGRMVPIPENGSLTYFTTTGTAPVDPPPPLPGEPSVYLSSVDKNTLTWRITSGSNTTRIYIDRSWSTVDNTSLASNTTWYYDYIGQPGTKYSIRVRGWNSAAGYGPWSVYREGTTEAEIVVGSIPYFIVTNTLTDRFTLSWDAASNAARYQYRYRREGTTAWTDDNQTGRSVVISGLLAETYYEYQIRAYNGSVYGSWTSISRVRTQSVKPTALNWSTFTSGNNITLTAKNWNDLTSKINAWMIYKGRNTVTMAAAYTGNDITAAMFNEVVACLVTLGATGRPSTVTRGNDITAAKINALGTAVDSLT